jgi:hypothetical protein
VKLLKIIFVFFPMFFSPTRKETSGILRPKAVMMEILIVKTRGRK